MYEKELMILGLALSLAIGEFSMYYLVFEKSFIDRFKKFNEAIQSNLIKDSEEFIVYFIHELRDKKTDPAGLVEFTNKWSARQSVALDISKSWLKISKHNRWILLSGFISVVCVGAYLFRLQVVGGAELLNFLHIATFCLALEIFHIFSFLMKFSRLSEKVSKYELGESLEKMLDDEVQRIGDLE